MNVALLARSLAALATASLTCCSPAQEPGPDSATAARRQQLHALGPAAPLSIHPVRLLGRANGDVADALGLVLEKNGMSDLEVATHPFDAGATAWDDVPARLREHVKSLPAATAPRYHLVAEFLGTPKTGPTEVRFCVVDPKGELVLTDRQTPKDKAFARTAGRDPDPLGCSTLVGERLFALAQWKQAPGSVPDGAFARRWRQKSGAPDDAEREAMEARRGGLRDRLPEVTVAVLPPLVDGTHQPGETARLARELGEALGCTATPLADGSRLEAAATSNEQLRLWSLAAALRKELAARPAAADYVLVADLAGKGDRGFAHVVVATRTGEIVLADFQNDQSPAWRGAKPGSAAELEHLVVARVRDLVR